MPLTPNDAEAPDLLCLRDLSVQLPGPDGPVPAVRGVSLTVGAGERVGLVGESGCGKTQTVLAALGLAPVGARVEGSARYRGQELVGAPARVLNRVRGARIGLVFQDPAGALNPHLRVATHMTEMLAHHRRVRGRAAREKAAAALEAVRIPDPARCLRRFPHELSGGMRQRVALATALLCEPELLVADEPTTALDVTVQADILALLDELRVRLDMALLLITHDLGVVAGHCDRVVVMYAGQVVESAPVDRLFAVPRHPYTRALLAAVPRLAGNGGGHPIAGTPPAPGRLPAGCAFAPRCPAVEDRCRRDTPALVDLGDGQRVACHRMETI